MSFSPDKKKMESVISRTLKPSDWIYTTINKGDMHHEMVLNLTTVLGDLIKRHSGPAKGFIEKMKDDIDEAFKAIRRCGYPKFRLVHVRSILGNSFENGGLECFMSIVESDTYHGKEREMFARLVVCYLACN